MRALLATLFSFQSIDHFFKIFRVLLVGYRGVFHEFFAGKLFAPGAIVHAFCRYATSIYRTDIVSCVFRPIYFAFYFATTRALYWKKLAFRADRAARRRLCKFVLP